MEIRDINLQTHIRRHTGLNFDELYDVRNHVITLLSQLHGIEVPPNLTWTIRHAQNGAYGFELVSETFPVVYPDARIHIRAQSTPPKYAWWFYPEWSRMEGKMHEIHHGTLD